MKKKTEQAKLRCDEALRIAAPADQGLTAAQAAQRLEEGLSNVVSDTDGITAGKIVRSNLLTYFNLIFFLLAAVLLWEGSYNNLTFLIVVVVNAVIGIVQELRSKKTLDSLKLVSTPVVTVLRDGKEQQIPGDQLVLDDIAYFGAGNQICADATVLSGEVSFILQKET